jgi:hypothetical protein
MNRSDRTFDAAHAEWLRVRTAVIEESLRKPDKNSEQRSGAALDTVSEAEWRLIGTPAWELHEIKARAQVLQAMFDDIDIAGRPTDNRHRIMLAVLVSEILRSEISRTKP